MTAPIRFGLIGCGNIAGRHATVLREEPSATLLAVSDLDPARAAAFAAEHGAEAAADVAALLTRDDVDAVVITAPATVHADLAARAIEHGKHVLLEKPIDVRLDEADRLLAAADRRGLRLSVISQNRFHDDVRWTKEILSSGRLGRPVLASVFSLWKRDQAYYDAAPGRGRHDASEGGVLLNQAVHAVDLMLWLMGGARSVLAHCALLTHEMAGEDNCVATVEFASGALGSVVASTSPADQQERLELRCERGTLVLENGRLVRHVGLETAGVTPPPPPSPEAQADKLLPFRRQHADFLDAIRRGRDPLVTGREAREVLAFILAATGASDARPARRERAAAHSDAAPR